MALQKAVSPAPPTASPRALTPCSSLSSSAASPGDAEAMPEPLELFSGRIEDASLLPEVPPSDKQDGERNAGKRLLTTKTITPAHLPLSCSPA